MKKKDLVISDFYELYRGDCLEIMQGIPDKSIDMVLCDLPYNVTKNSWDLDVIDLDALWKQYKRIIKDNGAIVLFGQDKFTAKLMLSEPKLHRYNLIWDKVLATGFLNANRMPLRSHEDICVYNTDTDVRSIDDIEEVSHEDICVFYKKLPTYNPQMELGDKPCHSSGKSVGKKIKKNSNYGDFIVTDKSKERGNLKYPKSILRFEKPHPSVAVHPTQKPVSLLKYLIESFTDRGAVVLDNTMGSGSTGIAALECGRYFIGIEKEEEFFDISKDRVESTLKEIEGS